MTHAPLLELQGVRKTYWRGLHELKVLRGVSLDVWAGELVAIYGQRGAGKTTLLKVAAGFERPDTGVVRFGGADVGRLSRRALARLHRESIGWVERAGPQSRELTMVDYVGLSLLRTEGHEEARRRATAALERVGARECARDRWECLSDSERMLVAIAAAIVRQPQLLVVDDPTASLDLIQRERVLGLLRSAAEEARVGVLMAVPDMPAMLHAHQVRSLSRGRLLAPSDPPEGRATVIDFPAGSERSA